MFLRIELLRNRSFHDDANALIFLKHLHSNPAKPEIIEKEIIAALRGVAKLKISTPSFCQL